MGATQLIDIAAFMQHLRDEGLVIVRAEEIGMTAQMKLNDYRRRMMKRLSLSYSEVLKLELLPVKSANGLDSWAEKHLKPDDLYQEAQGKKRRMIMTAAIKRLGYYE